MKIRPQEIIHPVVEFNEVETLLVAKYLIREGYAELSHEFRCGNSECRLFPDGISGVEQITYNEKSCIFYPKHRHYSGGRVFELAKIKMFIDTHKDV